MHGSTHEEQTAIEGSRATAHPRRTTVATRCGASRSGASDGGLAPVGVALGRDIGKRRLRSTAGSRTYRAPTFLAENFVHLNQFARNRLKSMQRRPRLIAAFWKQAELSL